VARVYACVILLMLRPFATGGIRLLRFADETAGGDGHYADEMRGLRERRRRFQAATSGVERLESYVEFWGNYIPEVYGMAWSGTRRPSPASLSGERRKAQ
jgi:hypothetical protein